jgi:DNA-binding NarL/FixJ family response regulator
MSFFKEKELSMSSIFRAKLMEGKRILILEDEVIVALDIKEILENLGYECRVFHDYANAMESFMHFKPHLAICDIDIGDGPSGIEFVRQAQLYMPRLAVIYLTAFSDRSIVELAGKTHPVNYILKPWSDHQIRVSVEMVFDQMEARGVLGQKLEELTHTEWKVLELVAQNKKTKEIAEILFISEKTVKNHRYHISKKLNLSNENNSLLAFALSHFGYKNEA